MSCFRSNLSFLLLFNFSLFLFVFSVSACRSCPSRYSLIPDVVSMRQYNVVLPWKTRRSLASGTTENPSLVLAEERTIRKDPLDHFKRYRGGWNFSDPHYYSSVVFTAAPFFITAAVWFVIFGLCFFFFCLCSCCCPREPYGYSEVAYTWSRIFLIVFTLVTITGCVVLYNGQGEFFNSTSDTLNYVVRQAESTARDLRNVSSILDTAKGIGVHAVILPSDVQKNINDVKTKTDSASATLSSQTEKNSKYIRDGIKGSRVALIILAAVMLVLSFLGFISAMFGMQCLVYFLVILGWILVTGTFILSGVFLCLHNVVGDTCIAMHDWDQNPKAHTALDDILPCVDNATAQETLLRSKEVTYQLVTIIDNIITNMTNQNLPSSAGLFYYNQSGPLMPLLCNPFNSDFTNRQCSAGEVALDNASQVWKDYTCEVSSSGICSTPGRMTPTVYCQMSGAVNVSYGLHHYGPFLLSLVDCSFVRDTFSHIDKKYCPGLRRYSELIYVGLAVVSAAVMLSLIFWVIYVRERRHRAATKNLYG